MKQAKHPKNHPVIFHDVATGKEYFSLSTLTSDETKTVDDVSYYVIKCDVTSSSHPFFTGEQRFVDRQGLVDKFRRRQEKGKQTQQKQAKKSKKNAPTPAQEPKSYREVLRESKKQVQQAQQ